LSDIVAQLKDDPKNKKLLEKQNNRQKQLELLKKITADDKKRQDNAKVNSGTCSKIIKKYIKENDLKTCNDKEACSLILLMILLKKNGVCAGVLKEGVFFDKKYSSIRKCLIEQFNVKYVISVPHDQFENTSTKTSIVIFENTKEKTKEIVFYDLIVEKEHDDVFEEIKKFIQLVKSKGDIFNVKEKELCRCTVNDMNDDYSLNYKNYLRNDVVCQKGFKLVKLGDLCKSTDGYAFKTNDMKDVGVKLIQISNINDNMVTFKDDTKHVTYCEKYKKYVPSNGDIIVGMTGNIQTKIAIFNGFEKCVLNQRVCKINEFETNVSKMYVYNYWLIFELGKDIQFKANGTVQKNISKCDLLNTQIPYPNDATMKKLTPVLTKLMKLHEESQKLSNDIPQKEKDICAIIKKLTDEGMKGKDYDEYKLENITEILYGGSKISEKNGIYPLYAGGINPSKFIDKYNIEKNTIIVSRSGNSAGLVQKTNSKAFIASFGYYFKLKEKINVEYLYYFLKTVQKDIFGMTNATVKPNLNRNNLYVMTVKILKPEILKKHKLDKLFEEVNQMKTNLETNKKEHSELSVKFMKMIDPNYGNTNDITHESKNDVESSDESSGSDNSDSELETEVKPKKVQTKKKIVVSDSDDSSELETEVMPKKVKTKKKIVVSDSDDSSELETEVIPKKRQTKKKLISKKFIA
jgi:type I restriction enzyme, S subunit